MAKATKVTRRVKTRSDNDRIKRNGQLLKDKQVTLGGEERFFIQHAIERTPQQERTASEKRLLEKVR